MQKIADSLNTFGLALSRFSTAIGCSAIIIMMCIITYNVIMRLAFNHPIDFAEEYSAFMFVVVVFMGLGHVTRKDIHVRVDLAYNTLSEKKRIVMDLVTFTLSFVVALIYLRSAFETFMRTFEIGERSIITATPLWLPKIFMVFGLFVFALEIANWIVVYSIKCASSRNS
jgi:TRAP-type C4-dicarboxylate transport system permease small subunit